MEELFSTLGEPAVRIVADDLSGALDAAGPFARYCGRFPVYWNVTRACSDAGPLVGLDLATREVEVGMASERMGHAARALWSGWRGIAFQKLDSAWRGSPAAEIAAATTACDFDRAIVAPAFPRQGRITRDGGQWIAEGAGWRCAVDDIAAELRRHGLDAASESRASPSTRAVVCDATADADLDAIVVRHMGRSGRTLWCGTGGLSRALAMRTSERPVLQMQTPSLRTPVLFVVGTDHPVSAAQADALAAHPNTACRTVDVVTGSVRMAGPHPPHAMAVLIRFAVPAGAGRDRARELIEAALLRELADAATPGLVVVTGGETVRSLGHALGATRLDVLGEFSPGIPVSVWGDGRWAGKAVLSKSGGFGAPDLFPCILASVSSPHS
jgi:uncharacterized protein YgbK (DUF1537 family)